MLLALFLMYLQDRVLSGFAVGRVVDEVALNLSPMFVVMRIVSVLFGLAIVAGFVALIRKVNDAKVRAEFS